MKPYYTVDALEHTGLVRAVTSLRQGGVSQAPYRSLNLGEHVGDDIQAVRTNREMFCQAIGLRRRGFVYCRQVHSDCVVVVDESADRLQRPIAEADAMVANRPSLALGVFTADCVPIFVLDVGTPAIGIIHAGWRGALAGIAAKTIRVMRCQFGSSPSNCRIHLGPSIQKCCYQVDVSLAEQFERKFGPSVRVKNAHIDLHAANVHQLVHAGVPTDAISATGVCTACRTDLFFSHRAENGLTGRLLSVIVLVD